MQISFWSKGSRFKILLLVLITRGTLFFQCAVLTLYVPLTQSSVNSVQFAFFPHVFSLGEYFHKESWCYKINKISIFVKDFFPCCILFLHVFDFNSACSHSANELKGGEKKAEKSQWWQFVSYFLFFHWLCRSLSGNKDQFFLQNYKKKLVQVCTEVMIIILGCF